MDGFTQSALLKALGWSLFDSLWQMALLWLCYVLLVSVFSKMAAHSRHGLAVLLIGMGTGSTVFSFVHYMTADGAATGAWLNSLLLTAQHPGYALPDAARQFIDRLLPYCSLFYLLALGFLFVRYSNHYLHARRLKEEGLSGIGPVLRVFVGQTALRLGIKKEVGVWLSSIVEGPVTLGFLRPVILIPFAMINNLSLEQVEAILLHELAHIKRYDYLLNLGMTLAQLLFFFNPFARLLIRHIKREREHRCDDLVIQFRYDPHAYASALLTLAAMSRHRHALALAAAGKNDQLLLHRVKRILKKEEGADRPGARSAIIFLFPVLAAFFISPHRTAPGRQASLLSRSHGLSSRSLHRESIVQWPSQGSFSTPQPLKKAPASREINQPGQPADPKNSSSSLIDEQEDQPLEQGIETVENCFPSDDHAPSAITISISRISPGPLEATDACPPLRLVADSTEAGQLLAALTDAKSSASQVKAKIIKAIAANDAALAKTREALNSSVLAIRECPTAVQRMGQRSQKQLLEDQVKMRRQEIIMQQDMKQLLQRAARRLTIVYI